MMRAQSPAAWSIASRIEGADLASPIAPQRNLRPRRSKRNQVGRRRSELCSSSVDCPVGISDAGRDRLLALKRAAVCILTVPCEGRLLVWRRWELSLHKLPGDADLEFDMQDAGRQLAAAQRDLDRVCGFATRSPIALVMQSEVC